MSTKLFNTLDNEALSHVCGGQWILRPEYKMECWNGVFDVGNCRVRWDMVMNTVVERATTCYYNGWRAAAPNVTIWGSGGCGRP